MTDTTTQIGTPTHESTTAAPLPGREPAPVLERRRISTQVAVAVAAAALVAGIGAGTGLGFALDSDAGPGAGSDSFQDGRPAQTAPGNPCCRQAS